MELFHIKNLSFTYPKKEEKALDDISFTILEGDFLLLCGQTGCGKTTLLKMLKRQIRPFGKLEGEIFYNGISLENIDDQTAATEIGYVLQDPDSQIVTDKVWHELSFGLENIGLQTDVIRRRVGEMASFFGIEEWFRSDTSTLSGGQKQLLNLASVMVMQPKVLMLDEPTSSLDPIAAADFIAALQKINRQLGVTVIMAEHRLEDVFSVADKVLIMEKGRLFLYDSPHLTAAAFQNRFPNHPMKKALPTAAKIFIGLNGKGRCPVTVKEGRRFLTDNFPFCSCDTKSGGQKEDTQPALCADNLWFRYERGGRDILRGVNFKANKGEISAVLGGNGTGKTTLLNVLSKALKPYRGNIGIEKKQKSQKEAPALNLGVALLPQDPKTLFLYDTIKEDFENTCKFAGYNPQDIAAHIEKVGESLDIVHLFEKHPYDISGGEQQKCALAKLLLLEPDILLLDEPTKGIDAFGKGTLSYILKQLKSEGKSIVMVTHDIEFAAECADRCALFFDGQIISEGAPKDFFAENNFYTTAANRMARHICKSAITAKDVINICRAKEQINE